MENTASEIMRDVEYPLYGRVSRLLPQLGAQLLSVDYDAAVHLTVRVATQQRADLEKELCELSAGSASCALLEEGSAQI